MLPSGNVLVAGGVVTNNTSIAEAEVFDVKARQWAAVGPMATPRQNHQVLDADPDAMFGAQSHHLAEPVVTLACRPVTHHLSALAPC
jgi:hypothetical protein